MEGRGKWGAKNTAHFLIVQSIFGSDGVLLPENKLPENELHPVLGWVCFHVQLTYQNTKSKFDVDFSFCWLNLVVS